MRTNAPAPAITGPVVRLSLYSVTSGQTCINTFDYMASAPFAVSSTDLVQLASAFSLAYLTQFTNVTTVKTTFGNITAALISANSVPTQTFSGGAGTAGTLADVPLPIEMSAVMLKHSNLKGQHGRGRFSFPAVPSTFTTPGTDPNLLNAAAVLAWLPLTGGLKNNIVNGGTTWQPCISTRPLPPSYLVTNAVPVTSMSLDTLLGTVRRRKEGRGI